MFFISDKIVDYPTGVQEECKKLKAVQTELKTCQPSLEKAIATPKNISNLISNKENSKKIVDVNSSLDKLHVSQDLPIELKAEVSRGLVCNSYCAETFHC